MSSGETTGAGTASFSAMSTLRPWPELLSPTALSLPASFSDATVRLLQNLDHFRANYAAMAVLVLFLGLIAHPLALIVLLFVLAAWFFLYLGRAGDEPLVVAGFAVSDGVVLAALGLLTVVAVAATKVWRNVVVSVAIGAVVVCLHAVLRSTDDLVSDDRRSPYGQLAAEDDPQGTYTII